MGFRFMFKDRLVSDAYIKINRGFVENLQETACGGSVLGTAAKGFENFRSFFVDGDSNYETYVSIDKRSKKARNEYMK